MFKLSKIKNNGRIKFLIIDRARISSIIKNYLAIKILEKKIDIKSLVVSDLPNNHKLYRIYNDLGFNEIYKSFGPKVLLSNFIIIIKSLFKLLTISNYIVNKNFHKFIYHFKVSKILVGDIIYDRFIRNDFRFLKPSFFDINFIKICFYTIFKVYYLENFIKQKKINTILINTHIYSNNYSIVFKISKKLKINLLYIKDFQITYFKKGRITRENDPRVITKKKLKKINLNNFPKKKLQNILDKRIKGKLTHFDFKLAYGNQNKLLKNTLMKSKINISKFSKIVLVASHALSDANHFYKEFDTFSPFKDYYSQLVETLQFAQKNKDILFLVRPHPSSYYWKEESVIPRVLEKYKNENIFLANEKFSTADALEICDTVITVYGTIGLEAAGYFGKKPILAGKSIYSGLGFSFDCLTKKQYFKNILAKKHKFRLSANEKEIAIKALYYHQEILNKDYKSVIATQDRLVKTEEYLKNLKKFLKKKNVKNDKYFKNLVKYLYEKID